MLGAFCHFFSSIFCRIVLKYVSICLLSIRSRRFLVSSPSNASWCHLKPIVFIFCFCVASFHRPICRFKSEHELNRSVKAAHVPYRNSKLTFALQDMLSGGAKVLLYFDSLFLCHFSLLADANCCFLLTTPCSPVMLKLPNPSVSFSMCASPIASRHFPPFCIWASF